MSFLMKSSKELKYVHYLLRVEHEASKRLSTNILETIRRKVLTNKVKYNGIYVPLYITYSGEEAEMPRNTAFFEIILNTRQLTIIPDSQKP